MYIYSPFVPESLSSKESACLLLQFFMDTLWSTDNTPLPFPLMLDFHHKATRWDKLQEHAQLLAAAFPDLLPLCLQIQEAIKERSSQDSCWALIEPLIESCKEDANLWVFLLKNRDRLGLPLFKKLLRKCYPEGKEELLRLLKEQLENRGFSSMISQLENVLHYV